MAVNNSPSLRRGTSGSEGSDLRPGYRYDVDLRRLSEDERDIVEKSNAKQDTIDRRVKATKAAGAYRKRTLIDQPAINGKTPKTPGSITTRNGNKGSTVPSRMNGSITPGGSTTYPTKPGRFSGEVFY